MLYHLANDPAEQSDLAHEHRDRTQEMLHDLGQWELRTANPIFREPADWRVRHLKFYDCRYPLTQLPSATAISEKK